MEGRVKKWGNSAAVRIPAAVLDAIPLALDASVDISAEAGRIVIAPLAPASFDLRALIEAITDDNRHDEIPTAAPRGKEAW